MKTLAVINPRSGAGRMATTSGRIARLLAPLGPSLDLAFTSGPMDAARCTRQGLKDGVERIVAVGGDGTVNEVVNGFFDHGAAVNPDAELAIVEFGTGGDLRKTLGIPDDPRAAVARIVSGSPHRMDVGRLSLNGHNGRPTERLFLNVASFGVSGNTVRRVDGNQRFKRITGGLAYAVAAFVEVMSYQPRRVRITLDNQPTEEIDLIACAVCNGRYFGGGMKIAPMAEPDDGWFDVITIEKAPKLELLSTIPALFTGRHLEKSCVRHVRARRVSAELVESGKQMFVETDGESAGLLTARFDVLPKVLTLRC